MIRNILGVVAGVVAWGVLFNAGWLGLSAVRPDTFTEDKTTTDPMNLVVLLLVSFVVSITTGWLSRTIAKNNTAVVVLAGINLLIGIGVQASGWDGFPVWYHIPFLLGVIPFTILGGKMGGE